MNQEKIDRINTLYHKAKATGLSEEEKAEQAALRKEYIEAIRHNMRANLNNISIKEKDGTVTDLGKKYGNIKEV
ncbi:DUF896 family protein [Clostridium sp. chh4-2]|uniref:DUF896 domain-containing protein n=1 Tax=Clostridium sp. chh4-2 TaxID=2067550 RepID=UPI000CCF48F7|nr:DUF896 domain-containing protein [Clostridium sp. chh4-2]PNV59748.1 DUF896 family protein [Clostridium sp. chh4-2]